MDSVSAFATLQFSQRQTEFQGLFSDIVTYTQIQMRRICDRIFSGASKGQKNTQWISPRSQLAICSGFWILPYYLFFGKRLKLKDLIIETLLNTNKTFWNFFETISITVTITLTTIITITITRPDLHPAIGCGGVDSMAALGHTHYFYVPTRRASKVMVMAVLAMIMVMRFFQGCGNCLNNLN